MSVARGAFCFPSAVSGEEFRTCREAGGQGPTSVPHAPILCPTTPATPAFLWNIPSSFSFHELHWDSLPQMFL